MKEVRQKTISKTPKRAVNKAGRKGELVSLHPLTPEEVMRATLQVPPTAKDKQEKQIKKRA